MTGRVRPAPGPVAELDVAEPVEEREAAEAIDAAAVGSDAGPGTAGSNMDAGTGEAAAPGDAEVEPALAELPPAVQAPAPNVVDAGPAVEPEASADAGADAVAGPAKGPEPAQPQAAGEAVPEPVGLETARDAAPEPVQPAAGDAAAVALAAAVAVAPSIIEPSAPTTEGAVGVEAPVLVPLEEIAPAIRAASLSRRVFLGFGLAIAGGLAGAAGLSRLFPVFADSSDAASPIVPAYDPAGKRWTFVVDTQACIGCGLCVVACKEENHVPEEAAYTRTWVERHVVTADGALYVDSPEAGINGFPAESTAPGAAGKPVEASWFEPRLCMQCEESPCTSVCPVGATYRTEDGVILVDSRRCIGCGYCVVACPYGARYLVPAGGDAPNGTPGVADKCTWCYHRISRGAKPACVEVCPVGARRFGDASDPDDEIATLVRERKPQMLHPEYGTRPRVLYLGPSVEKEA